MTWGRGSLYRTLSSFWLALSSGFPGRKMCLIGISGAKGKTTALEILNSMLSAAGRRTAVLSSLRITAEEEKVGAPFRFLRQAEKEGAEYALIEISAEGARKFFHRFLNWNIAALTNFHPDSIDAFGSLENYRQAELSYLSYAAKKGAKVFLNQNDSGSEYFWERLPSENTIFFSSALLPELPSGAFKVLKGDFNKDNLALALAIAEYLHLDKETIRKGLLNLRNLPGRLEYVQKEPFAVIVDYARTPDSLEAVYQAVKVKGSRLICVLGAEGERDKWKRPMLGKIAAEYCEEIILTNEDPGDENPEIILQEIAAGAKNKKVKKILDRKNAILEAVRMAKPKDTVLITGKGNGPWMRVSRGKKIPWSERLTVEEALDKK